MVKKWTSATPTGTRALSKPQLAQAMVSRALEAGLPLAWFTADEAYGQAKWLQAWLEERGVSYVMAVRRSDTFTALVA
jgi:SRSO17 transposase